MPSTSGQSKRRHNAPSGGAMRPRIRHTSCIEQKSSPRPTDRLLSRVVFVVAFDDPQTTLFRHLDRVWKLLRTRQSIGQTRRCLGPPPWRPCRRSRRRWWNPSRLESFPRPRSKTSSSVSAFYPMGRQGEYENSGLELSGDEVGNLTCREWRATHKRYIAKE
jgi:hypothetical protein